MYLLSGRNYDISINIFDSKGHRRNRWRNGAAKYGGRRPELHILTGSGFYDEDIRIEVELEKEGKVFYTSDGSMPAKEEGGSTLLYKEPVFLAAEEEESVEVYRFLAVFQDGTESEIVTNTYFMGKNIKDRYDTMIISLAAEDDDLYGYENGIFVEGKLRADWEAQHPGEEAAFDAPANYNVRGRESERNVHIEIFEPDGKRLAASEWRHPHFRKFHEAVGAEIF